MVAIRMEVSLCDEAWMKVLSKKARDTLLEVPRLVRGEIDALISDADGDDFSSVKELDKWITDGGLETMGVVHGWYDSEIGLWAYETMGGKVIDTDENGYTNALADAFSLGIVKVPRHAVVRMRGKVRTLLTYRGADEDAVQVVLRRDGWSIRLGDNSATIEMWEDEISRALARVPDVWDGVAEYVFSGKKILDARRTTKCGVVKDWWMVADCYGLAIRTPGTDSKSNIAARKVSKK